MAGLKIEGDLSQISDNQLKYIKNVIEERGFKNKTVTIEPVGKAGDNYVANVKRIIVNDDKGGNFKMVAKVAPTNEAMREMANTESLFRNEHIMYTKVLPKFTQLEKAADVLPEERLRYAACYGSSDDAPNEVILLEDLKDSNFVMLDRFKPLSSDCIKSVLKSFASLHSLSYVLKYKEPELFEEYTSSLFDMWAAMENHPETLQFFGLVEASAAGIVEKDVHKKAIKGALPRALKEFGKMAKYERYSKHAIIQQGDSWNNNIMFQFDEETLKETIMIDYQLSKASNPAADILYMVFSCSDYETRKEHYHDWIDFYHTELDNYLSNYGLKASFVFPRDQLDADLKRYGKAFLGLSIMQSTMLVLKVEEAMAVKEALESADIDTMLAGVANSTKDPENVALVKKRLEGIVDSFYEFGLI